MQRLGNWDVALARAVAAQSKRPHDWGPNNCALRAAELIAAMTGVDLAADIRPLLPEGSTRDDALRVMAARGWRTVADIADEFFARVPVRAARRGDLLLIAGPDGDFLAVKTGAVAVAPAGPDNAGVGIVYRRAGDARMAWRV